ncbi:unnamed protein product [Auanema sp. JU1783]|nr:unnamed protein product [Auanema sp. JU1783]
MVAVEPERIQAVLLWINEYGFDERLNLPAIQKLAEVWKRHLLAIGTLIEAREPGQCSVSSAADTFELALGVLKGADDAKSPDQRGRVSSLSAEKAASGNESEIYKFLVLFLHEIALFSKDWIQKFIPALQEKSLETAFASILEQCANNVESDSWWRSEPFTPNRDIILTPVRTVVQTPKVRKISHSKFTSREEVFTTDDLGSPIKNLLNSPRINEMRIEQYSVKERKLNEKIHGLEEEKMVLEEKMVILRKETTDLTLDLHNWKQKASDLERELSRANESNKKYMGECDTLEKEKRILAKQAEDKAMNVEKFKGYLEDSENKRSRALEEIQELQLRLKTYEENLSFIKDEKDSLYSENNQLKRNAALMEKQAQDLISKVDTAHEELQREKLNFTEKLKSQEHELVMIIEEERNLRLEAHRKVRELEEELAEKNALYLENLEREKLSALRYKQSKEEAEENLSGKKKEWEEYIKEMKSSHEREVNSLKEFNDYFEKKHESLNEEMEFLKSSLSKSNSEFSVRENDFLDCMKTLKMDLEKSDTERKLLKRQVVETESQIAQLRKDLNDTSEDKRKQVTALEEYLETARERIAELEDHVYGLKAVLRDMVEKFSTAETFMESLVDENAALREQLEDLEKVKIEIEEGEMPIPDDFPVKEETLEQVEQKINELGLEDNTEEANDEVLRILDDAVTSGDQMGTVMPDVNEDEEPCEMFSTLLDGSCVSNAFLPPRESHKGESQGDQQTSAKQEVTRRSSFDFSVPSVPKKSPQTVETDKSRITELKQRNTQVPSALKCSYSVETMNYSSPSGGESSIKGKNTGSKTLMKRMSHIINRKGKENDQAHSTNKVPDTMGKASRGPLVNKNS